MKHNYIYRALFEKGFVIANFGGLQSHTEFTAQRKGCRIYWETLNFLDDPDINNISVITRDDGYDKDLKEILSKIAKECLLSTLEDQFKINE